MPGQSIQCRVNRVYVYQANECCREHRERDSQGKIERLENLVNYNNKKFSQSFFNNKRYTAVRNYTLKWHRSRLYLTTLFFGFLLIGILVPVLAKKEH